MAEKEYIEREAVLNHADIITVHTREYGSIDVIPVDCVSDIPAADVAEVRHGKNLEADTPSLFECSECHWFDFDTTMGYTSVYNYCPNCGAKMDGKEKT